MHVSELRHPDDAPAATAGRAQLAQGAETVRMENRFRHRDGSWRWIAWTMTAHQGLIYVAGRHITAEREAQALLRRSDEARAQQQKMEALGQLTGGVAHDFNNLLMIVSGHIARLKKAAAADPKAARAAEAIELAAHRGQSLTRQLLSFARRQPVNPVVVDPAACIAAMRPMLASSVGAAAELVVETAPDLAAVLIDVNEFELALINLVLNARDAVAQGDTITVSARNVRLTPGMTVENLAGDFVAVSVADTGAGIAADVLSRVFEPFFTTKPGDKGTGLGLSQVHGFAQRSGGGVTIESDVGKGTVVTLYLPRTDAPPQRAAHEPATVVAGGSALLVEDNPEVADASRDMLAELGFAVNVAHDAQGALVLIGRRDFDLVVSDIVMPGDMNGAELARAIRARKPHLPIILVTGYAGPASSEAADFLVLRKPYLAADLRRAIAQVTRGEAVADGM
jgi:signal transduction histidine kinase/CheY-like chemotaxis protein